MNNDVKAGSICVSQVSKRLGRRSVLEGLNFTAESGQIIGILGPNGAGKTTFLRLLSTLMRADKGKIEMAGYQLPNEAAFVRRAVGFVSHAPLLYTGLSAEENLRFYTRLYDLSDSDHLIQNILELVGLSGKRHDQVRTFSRGMQQRLALGRAILHHPKILLLDEPFNGLDLDACERFAGFIKRTTAEGMTVLLASHQLSGIELLADRFDILIDGHITRSCSKNEIKSYGLEEIYRENLKTVKAQSSRRLI